MIDLLQNARRLVPVRAIPWIVDRRLEAVWRDPQYVEAQEKQMRYLLEYSPRAEEAPRLAREYARQSMLRTWMRWHPGAVTRQRVQGIEWLTSKQDTSRAAILSFMHHNQYDGLFGSLARAGARIHVLALDEVISPEAPVQVRQHFRVVAKGATLIPAGGGGSAIAELLRPGVTLAIASDVASKTPVEFLGRPVLGAFGAPRIAFETNSPVVLVTSVRDGADSSYLQVHEPLEPLDFTDPRALLNEMLRVHGEAILAWPEAYENPTTRFGPMP